MLISCECRTWRTLCEDFNWSETVWYLPAHFSFSSLKPSNSLHKSPISFDNSVFFNQYSLIRDSYTIHFSLLSRNAFSSSTILLIIHQYCQSLLANSLSTLSLSLSSFAEFMLLKLMLLIIFKFMSLLLMLVFTNESTVVDSDHSGWLRVKLVEARFCLSVYIEVPYSYSIIEPEPLFW